MNILSGTPGAVLLYPLLGFVIYPRTAGKDREEGLLSRRILRFVLAGFWVFAALLQLQPNWWQAGQISSAIGAMVGAGGLNTIIVDPVLRSISNLTANAEFPLNIILIVVFLALGIALAVVKDEQVRPFLIASYLQTDPYGLQEHDPAALFLFLGSLFFCGFLLRTSLEELRRLLPLAMLAELLLGIFLSCASSLLYAFWPQRLAESLSQMIE